MQIKTASLTSNGVGLLGGGSGAPAEDSRSAGSLAAADEHALSLELRHVEIGGWML